MTPERYLLDTSALLTLIGDEAGAERRYAFLRQAATTVLWHVDEPLLLTAARLKAQHRVSFADAVIAAYAVRHDAILVHKDPEFDCLAGRVRMEALPYDVGARHSELGHPWRGERIGCSGLASAKPTWECLAPTRHCGFHCAISLGDNLAHAIL